MTEVLTELYGLADFESKKMEGYESENYRIKAGDLSYVLKIYQHEPGLPELLQAESLILQELATLDADAFPVPIPNRSGAYLSLDEDKTRIYRLLSFVEGTFFADAHHTTALFHSLGHFMATLDKQLLNFRHPALEARQIVWDLQYFLHNEILVQHIEDESKAKIVKYFFLQYKEHVLPELPHLRKSAIHNDGNEWNLLTKNDKISGIIDFGDMAYTPIIHELAIAVTYGIMGKEDPLSWALPILQGYHRILPLQEKEIDLLYYLIAARLCTSVCNSAKNKKLHPENDYITISEQPAWDLLHYWLTINPTHATTSFKKALGMPVKALKTIEEVLGHRHRNISKSLSLSYHEPIYMQSAAFQYMYDRYGNTYLDAYNNIPHVGHQHPEVVAAAQRQMARLNTNTRYIYDLLGDYAEKILTRFPATLSKVFFVNSGSAASDLAIRLATNYTKKRQVMVMEHGYHGNTRMGIEISHYKYSHKGGNGQASHILKAPLPDAYRLSEPDDGTIGQHYAQLATQQLQDTDIAAFIAEPIVGCGGQVPLPKDYLKNIYPVVRSKGGVCISDEVQVGFGRLGEYFWGYEMQEVVPDIVVLGKPMGNGHPLAAVVTTAEIAQAFDNGMEFFSSFGGNPVSCAIGMAVLEVIEKERLQENAATVGNYFTDQLTALQDQFTNIGDVRGSGLFLGVEIVKDATGKEHDTLLADQLKNELKNRKILVSTDGPYDNVIKMKPPLCFNKNNVDQVISELVSILSASQV